MSSIPLKLAYSSLASRGPQTSVERSDELSNAEETIEDPETLDARIGATQHALAAAVHRVFSDLPELWVYDLGERARVAHVARVLAELLPGEWDVDVEYNRWGTAGEAKRWGADPERLGTPDLVVHHRGLHGPEHNLLIAEFKNDFSSMTVNSVDVRRVASWVELFKYQVGAVVGFGDTRHTFNPKVIWKSEFHLGEAVEPLQG